MQACSSRAVECRGKLLAAGCLTREVLHAEPVRGLVGVKFCYVRNLRCGSALAEAGWTETAARCRKM